MLQFNLLSLINQISYGFRANQASLFYVNLSRRRLRHTSAAAAADPEI
jgi:hypothetical protein